MRHRLRNTLVAASLLTGPLVCAMAMGSSFLSPTVHAQVAQAVDDQKIWSGVYTSEQAQRGQKTYEAFCTRCHALDLMGGRGAGGGPGLKNNNFWVSWERAQLSDLLSKISRTMPLDSPASLRDDDYTDLVSFILSQNTFPAGKAELASSAVAGVRIVRPAGTATEVPNFSLVQVVGCLSGNPQSGWMLTRATAPQATREETANDAALRDASARPLGSDQMRLVGAGHLKPEAAAGRRVEARGLLRRSPTDARLDLLSLQTVAGSCAN